MKRLIYFSSVIFIATVLWSCNEANLEDDLSINIDNMSSKLLESSAVIGVCQPINTPKTEYLAYRDIENYPYYFYPAGTVLISHDAINLYIEVQPSYGFQPVSGNIDLGFYKTLPALRPDFESFSYHYDADNTNATYKITIPLNAVLFEDDETDTNGYGCGEQINMILRAEVFNSALLPVVCMIGTVKNPSDLNLFYKYTLYNPCCCSDETAWADGTRYLTKGNWATFTQFIPASTINIFAGQTFLAGTVTFGNVVDGRISITINLNDGFSLHNPEAIKIEDYDVAPFGIQPIPGQFSFKFNSLEEISVPEAKFYGIHLDLFKCK